MRLLHSKSLEFEVFEGENIPPYAILSHTWGSDEVSYQDMLDGSGRSKAGYDKIKGCGIQATEDHLHFIWVDTCCIDKSSSAELTEAINSMYNWYKQAAVCYAYLSDVSSSPCGNSLIPTVSALRDSRWFSRGWTLQELIAPADVVFFSEQWEPIGRRKDMMEQIQEITGIHTKALDGAEMTLFSVAERMSWASKRNTTRIEDIAYSLMGIFDVNMPLQYGEKEKAFIRLQEEIMKIYDDQSIFAWIDPNISPEVFTGLLAGSPKYFVNSTQISSWGIWGQSENFYMTNKGLKVQLYMIPYIENQGIYLASLECRIGGSFDISPGIYLKRISDSASGQFARINAGVIDELGAAEKISGKNQIIYIRQDHFALLQHSRSLSNFQLFRIKNKYAKPNSIYPPSRWNPETELFYSVPLVGKVGGILFDHDGLRYMIILGLSEKGKPWTHIIPKASSEPEQDWISYTATGGECPESEARFKTDGKWSLIWTEISTAEVYGMPLFVVATSAYSVPKTSDYHRMVKRGSMKNESLLI